MSREKKSAADLVRRFALLWGSQTEPGRSGLTVDAIVAAAIQIADRDGLAALSMRRIAEHLHVGTMSLYTHIPGKSELLDLMIDRTAGEVYERVEEAAEQPGDWRDALWFIARRNWRLYRSHPWLLEITMGRPVLGPHMSRKYEAELRPLDGIGLSDVDMDAALTLILSHVEGCARTQATLEHTRRDTGMSDVEWWVEQLPVLDKFIDPAHFPVATRVGTAAGEAHQGPANPDYTFTFGLECILAGIAHLIGAVRT